ncbi:MAG: alkaline phosphatase family protein [Planctomycetota bacterium]|nr:MAG: alkaline phosphatase family protein [Planctomycetota bacterium]
METKVKILIIGIDGATWEVLDDFLLENHMPNLKRLKSEGYSGVLQSTEPPITPAAWTTCITGCLPPTHGIVGFREYSFKDDTISIGNATSSLVPNIWQELSAQGFNVASINVPWTYPCQEIRGIMVAGHGSPGIFTYPNEFNEKLLHEIPDYDIVGRWDKAENYTPAQLESIITVVERSFEQRLQAARLANGEMDWSVMMVQFQDLDKLGHYMWPYIAKDMRDEYPLQRDRIFRMFKRLDQIMGDLLDLAATDKLLVAMVSDHGMTRKTCDVMPNTLLYLWGYMRFQGLFSRMVRRCRLNMRSLSSTKNATMPVELKSRMDWKQSKAAVMHTEITGYVCLNVRRRQPYGCVEPGKEYDNIIEDLRRRFSEVACPVTGRPIFERVATPAEIYSVEDIDAERFGDLILIPRPGYFLKSRMSQKSGYAVPVPPDSLQGTHHPDGIFVFWGQAVKSGEHKRAHIADIAPTVYAALGAKLPRYMDGKPLEDVFTQQIKIEFQDDGDTSAVMPPKKKRLSATEEAAVAKRLAELGYLD